MRFQYRAWHRKGAQPDRTGHMLVLVCFRKVKMTLADDKGKLVYIYDGVFSRDGGLVLGKAYPQPGGLPGPGARGWWATVETTRATPPLRVNLNTTSVATLESILPNGRAAWLVVEHRLFHGPYRTLADLKQVAGLDPRSLVQLQESTHVH